VGVFVGVYRIPLVFVKIVNLPVALPVICPGVMLAVTVKYLLTAVLFGNKSVPRVIGGEASRDAIFAGGKRFENGWYGGLGLHSAILSDVTEDDCSAGV
jgi:hypothetical protein